MALLKLAGHGTEKPWHQDHAYFNAEPDVPALGRERKGVQGVHLTPLGVYTEYSGYLPTRLNPLTQNALHPKAEIHRVGPEFLS